MSKEGKHYEDINRDLIDDIAKNQGFKNYDVKTRKSSNSSMGRLYEVDITGRRDNGEKDINLFIKRITPNTKLPFISIEDAYLNEVFVYKDLFKIMEELEEEANIPLQERYNKVKSYDQTNSQIVVLDNMKSNGFSVSDTIAEISLDFAVESMKQIAKFHAFSFVIEEMRPEYYEGKIKSIQIPYFYGEEWEASAINFFKVSMNALKGEAREKAVALYSVFLEQFPSLYNEDTAGRCVLCHGDYKPDNILYKCNDGKPTQVTAVDFQMLNYGCPMNDIIYFIFLSTDREFRRKHMSYLKNVYYESLGSFLKYFDIDVEDVYPRGDFEDTFKDRLVGGLLIMIFVIPMICVNGGTSKETVLDKRSEKRLQELVEDFIEWGYLF